MTEKTECLERNRSNDGVNKMPLERVTFKLVRQEDGKEIPNEEQAVFTKYGSGGVALSNHLVIENISNYLSDRDLDRWYQTFETFKHITYKMIGPRIFIYSSNV